MVTLIMMKLDESKGDLPLIHDAYLDFQRTGKVPSATRQNWSDKSKFFMKNLSYGIRRIDFEWPDPRYEEMDRRLKEISKKKGYKLETIGDLLGRNICELIKGKTAEVYVSQGVPIIMLRNVTNEGMNRSTDFVLKDFFAANP